MQYAFRRHAGTTPLGYLRSVRLAHTHTDLKAAAPHEGATVTGIAMRWGFTHPGRFSALYKNAYGLPPSATLGAEPSDSHGRQHISDAGRRKQGQR
ncbi:helix-turn-helix domain-containing protein [Streptomyces sp. Ru73]|uniref:helix-turn-helix domain-containing protein n=1 Tax=Streptomyces sp. Ru73 TaxID=2080748 RepID=UPI0027E55A88|nr:helix-turn-helix domain-containing protein [Streptomyces sp. Ru73]